MEKKDWFDKIKPVENRPRRVSSLRGLTDYLLDPVKMENLTFHIKPVEDLMADFEKFGFRDFGDHYELLTNLGGQRGEELPKDAVKVELVNNSRMVEITFEHSTSEDENNYYSHSQKTCVTLPEDADADTIKANFDEDGDVVVTVDKKRKEPENKRRSIPVTLKY